MTWKINTSLKWLTIHEMIVNCTNFYWKLLEVWNIKGILLNQNHCTIEQIFRVIFIPVSWVWLQGGRVESRIYVQKCFYNPHKDKATRRTRKHETEQNHTIQKKRKKKEHNRTYTVYFIPINTLSKWRIKQGTGGTSHLTIQ